MIRLMKYYDLLTAMARTIGYGDIGSGELSRSYYPQSLVNQDQVQQELSAEFLRTLKASENFGAPRQGAGGTLVQMPQQPPPRA